MRVTRQGKRAAMKEQLVQLKRLLSTYQPILRAQAILDAAREEGYQAGLAAGQSKSDAAKEGE